MSAGRRKEARTKRCACHPWPATTKRPERMRAARRSTRATTRKSQRAKGGRMSRSKCASGEEGGASWRST
eukprot:826587-Rhodomonas_salina.1